MPRRDKESFGEHHGKHKYISANFQKDWSAKGGKVEVKTNVELEQGYRVEVGSDIDLKDKLEDNQKEERRKLIKKHHPDRGGTSEKLKKVLDQYGD